MTRLGWMAGAKALAATTALVAVAMAASTAAQADYSYTFNITGLTPTISSQTTPGPVTGSFTLSMPANSANAQNVISSSYSYTINNMVFTGSFTPNFTGISSTSLTLGSVPTSKSYIAISGTPSFSNNNSTITARVSIQEQTSSVLAFGNGLFSATLSSSSGGGGSGGAPTPEVNAGLGMLLAGATFVFLRRKRGGRHAAVAA